MQRYGYDVSSRILGRSKECANGCTEYQGNWKHKYGLISITFNGKRKSVPASRAMWMALHDRFDLPASVVIRHKCDNQRCVNGEHLESGTHQDNMRDCIERKRRATKYKLHTRQRIINNEIIVAIKNEPNGIKQWHIAEKYGVSIGYVSKLRSGKAKTLV